MAAKKHLFRFESFTIKNGSEIRSWEDIWLGNASIQEQYPALYRIVRDKNDTLAQVLSSFSAKKKKSGGIWLAPILCQGKICYPD
jgi:hypothetical protein